MPDNGDPFPAITAWVDDAFRLNCPAVGFTIYPGSVHSRKMYEQVRELVNDARKAGLIVVVWAYPRGSGLPSKKVETAVDVVSYGVHIAAQLGAHIIKCKPTIEIIGLKTHIEKGNCKDVPTGRTRFVIKATFDGHRIVINSGGAAKEKEDVLEEVKALKQGGSFGSIVGRNSFQRKKDEGVDLLHEVQDIYA